MIVSSVGVQISLTQFLNFITKPAEQQLTVVRQIRKQHDKPYEPPPDLYKQFREEVARMHKRGWTKDYLDKIAAAQSEPARKDHYPLLAEGYKKFLARKNVVWFNPPEGVWECEGLRISVRPELGLVIDGTPTVLKLWLKDDDALTKRRAELVIHLMTQALPKIDRETVIAILDVRKGRLFRAGKSDHEQTVLLRAQARSFVSLYREL